MEQMRRFRRQHEQLRTVIVRVLRPNFLNQSMSESVMMDQTSEIKPEILALEAADANAIEEVNLAYDNVKEVKNFLKKLEIKFPFSKKCDSKSCFSLYFHS